jgi:hypothetical protein
MEYQISYETRGQYLLARTSGPYDPSAARDALRALRERAAQGGFTRILIDAMKVAAPMTEMHRYMMGEAFAEVLPPPFKVALLYPAMADKFAENTAVIRGADLFICNDECQAIEWLLSGGPDGAAIP